MQNPTDCISGGNLEATGYSYQGELWFGLCGGKSRGGWGKLWAKLALNMRFVWASLQHHSVPASRTAANLHSVMMYRLCVPVNYFTMTVTTINMWRRLIRMCNCVCQWWYYYVSFTRIWDVNSSPWDSPFLVLQVDSYLEIHLFSYVRVVVLKLF